MAGRILRAGLGQIRIGSSIEQNVAKITSFLAQGQERGVELIVFPEGAVGGYFSVDFNDPDALDGEAVEQGLQHIAQTVAETGVAAAVGVSRRTENGSILNTLVLWSRQGEIIGEYSKTHLTGSDRECYLPGQSLPVFDFEGVPVGLQICLDQRFPEPWRVLALRGAQVVLHGANSCGPDSTWKIPVIAAHLRSRAAENGIFVVSVNRGGPFQSWGSVAYDPRGLEIARANYDAEELVPANLDLTRETHFFLPGRRTDLIELVTKDG